MGKSDRSHGKNRISQADRFLQTRMTCNILLSLALANQSFNKGL